MIVTYTLNKSKKEMYLEILILILMFCSYFILLISDNIFLKHGQYRHWTGNIMDCNGDIDSWESFSEKLGFSGNPLFDFIED